MKDGDGDTRIEGGLLGAKRLLTWAGQAGRSKLRM